MYWLLPRTGTRNLQNWMVLVLVLAGYYPESHRGSSPEGGMLRNV